MRQPGPLALAAVLLAAAVNAAAMPAPQLQIVAPPEYRAEARRVERLAGSDFTAVLRMTGMVGFRRPITVVLAPESTPLARSTPDWVSGFADASRMTVVLFPARVPSYPDRTLEALLHHEVAHLMVAEAAGAAPVPRWFNEGVATVAAREWGLEDRARYALAVVGRDERTVADLDAAFAAGGRRARRAYALSASFIRFLEVEHGSDVTARILAEMKPGQSFRVAFRRATGQRLSRAEHVFFNDRALWTTWIPFLTSSVALWMGITLLALLAFARRRARSRELHERWDEVDARAHPPSAERPEEVVN